MAIGLSTTSAIAQINISGKVVLADGSPISYATVLLLNAQDSTTVIQGELTDGNGEFKIYNDASNKVLLEIRSLGFKTIRVELSNSIYNQIYQLEEANISLEEIEIVQKKPFFEQKIDRVIVNVGSYASNQGGSALDALSKAPGVFINQQNQSISMNGKEGVLVMINEKLIRVPLNVLFTTLEGMNSDNLQAIELIHQPSSKYDAGGNSGIINIVLKSNDNKGLSGTYGASVGYGQREKAGASTQFNYRNGMANLYGNYGYTYRLADSKYVIHNRSYIKENQMFLSSNRSDRNYEQVKQHAAQLGLDLEITKKTTIGLLSGIGDRKDRLEAHGTTLNYIDDNLIDITEIDPFTRNLTSSVFANLNVFHKINDTEHINLDLDYANYKLSSPGSFKNASSDIFDVPDEISVDKNTPLNFWTFKSDYSKDFATNVKLEIGVKGTNTEFENNADVKNLIDGLWVQDEVFSSFDKVEERILAGYSSLSFPISKTIQALSGIRYEKLTYDITSSNDANNLNRGNGALFPVAYLRHEIDSISGVQFSYNRRVTRPSYRQLTAYFIFLDPFMVISGNQFLQPGYSNTYKLQYNKNSLLFGLEYMHQNDGIFWRNIVDVETNIQINQQRNFDLYQIVTSSLSVPLRFFNWWNLQLNGTISQIWLKDDDSDRAYPISLSKMGGTFQMNNTVKFDNEISLELSGNYLSPRLAGEQVYNERYRINFGIQKKFNDGGNLSIAVNDVLNSGSKVKWDFYQPESTIRTSGDLNYSERQVRISYTRPFGNSKLKKERQRESGSETERKRL